MLRRRLLKAAAALPLAAFASPLSALAAPARKSRVRPGDPRWPDAAQWAELDRAVGGRLVRPVSVFAACAAAPGTAACLSSLQYVRNPFYLGDQSGGTQVSGWRGAWSVQPSAYAVAARSAADVVAGVNFARRNNLRLVVKGGGHSYLGGSNAPDSLLIWTRAMNRIALHDGFVPEGCAAAPVPAVTLDAGCMWIDAYTAVTTQAGRYVQGGGCTSVGVAGLVQGGGFGSFSKRFGLAAASLLQAEIVTADGVVRTVNACREPDLFWALKGGGGGSFGVVTRLTLKTHDLPAQFGYVGMKIKAASAEAYRRLVGRFIAFYAEALFNPHWGEAANFFENVLEISMASQGLDEAQVQAAWKPFMDWVRAAPGDYAFVDTPYLGAGPSRGWWDVISNPGMTKDERPGATPAHAWWKGDQDQVSMFIHGYDSAWLPASLLAGEQQDRLADALVAGSRSMIVRLHFNKGLAGAPAEENALARRCATNPAVADAFALMIVATGGPPPFPGLPKADPETARRNTENVARAAVEIARVAPGAGSYISETDYFKPNWREAFWGPNYPRLRRIKDRFDPDGLFYVHHGVGSEDWRDNGFVRV